MVIKPEDIRMLNLLLVYLELIFQHDCRASVLQLFFVHLFNGNRGTLVRTLVYGTEGALSERLLGKKDAVLADNFLLKC